jgi:hypothetical protein
MPRSSGCEESKGTALKRITKIDASVSAISRVLP